MDGAGALPDPAMKEIERPVVGASLQHHFTPTALGRVDSPLKTLWSYMQRPGMVSLAGGLPHHETFAFEELSGLIKRPDALVVADDHSAGSSPVVNGSTFNGNVNISIPMEVSKAAGQSLTEVQLKDALQYGTSHGLPVLAKIVSELSKDMFEPPYGDWHAFLTASATDAFSKVCQTFLDRGDTLLVDEYGYATAMATVTPLGIKPLGIKCDKHGMRPDALETALKSWDEAARGSRRPTVLYTVTVGHNPIGITWTAERKKEIYAICCKYDILVVEDDPYYYMQFEDYVRPEERAQLTKKQVSLEQWKAGLYPSFLKFDTQGRVIRLDTFSKTLAPGLRLGWATTNALFAQKLVHANETTTQSPAGFSQAFLAKLFQEWGFDGYYTYCRSLGEVYQKRRDMIIDALLDDTQSDGLKADLSTEQQLVSIIDPDKALTLLSFNLVEGGMFLWIRVHLSNHRLANEKTTKELFEDLWHRWAEQNTLVAAGSMFAVPQAVVSDAPANGKAQDDFFRLAFSLANEEQFQHAARVLRTVTRDFFA